MKKVSVFFGSLFFLMMISCGPTKNEAIDYNDHIMNILNDLTVSHNQFLNQIDGHHVDSLKIVHKLFSEKTKISLEEAKQLKDFDGKDDYKNAAIDYFTSLNDIANEQGKQMVDIMSRDYASLKPEDFKKIEELAGTFDLIYGKAYDKMIAAQAKFAGQWSFIIDPNKK